MAGAWLLKFIQSGSVQFYTLMVIASSIGLVIYRVQPAVFWIYLFGILLLALVRLVVRVLRPAGARTGPKIEA